MQTDGLAVLKEALEDEKAVKKAIAQLIKEINKLLQRGEKRSYAEIS